MRLDRALVRKACLGGCALLFGGIAALSVAFPREVAAQYGLTLPTTDAFNQFRAVFLGFWLGLSVLMMNAARRPDVPALGTFSAYLILFQGLARIASIALDGLPQPHFVVVALGEVATAITILATAPRLDAAPAPATEPS